MTCLVLVGALWLHAVAAVSLQPTNFVRINACPIPVCAGFDREQCLRTEVSQFRSGGRLCPGCETCVEEKPKRCLLVPCQIPSECDVKDWEYKYTTLSNGRRCRGCPKCKKPSLPCPVFDCLDIKEGCKKIVPTFFNLRDGTRCQGCPKCNDKEEVTCPLRRCVPPDCEKKRRTFFNFNGKRCEGCPKCVKLRLECPPTYCAACQPPPGYKQQFDKNGCPKCPPCGLSPLI